MKLNPVSIALSAALSALVCASVSSAALAQQIGKVPWDAAPRSASLSAQFQFQKKNGSGSSGGMDALTQYVTNYNSSSSSIGNYTQVNQTLGDGATGTVSQSAEQDSSGTQTSNADTHENHATNGSDNATAAGKGKGDKTATVLTVPAPAN